MQKPEDRIRCFNEICLASNPQNEKFCYQCGLPLVKRYLWVVNNSQMTFEPGQLIGDRYLCKNSNVFLDTKPGLSPEITENIPRSIQPYLKLSVFPLNVPRIFGRLLEEEEIWLLEYGTIPVDATGEPQYPQLLPSLRQLWPQASALQQLNWLLQITKLWEPLKSQGVLSSLLQEDNLKVHGSFLQLQQFHADGLEIHTIKDLGLLLQKWLPETSPSLQELQISLCQKIETGEIERSEQLLVPIDKALKNCQDMYEWSYSVYTQTDTGPSREHNEDACYPESGTLITPKTSPEIIAIVCDGIGGQDAGEVASKLATSSLEGALKASLTQPEEPNIYQVIKKAILKTNDIVCELNDQEHRLERQRMGTTLVMGLMRKNEVYLANLGDSRAYWITKNSCHQVTVDDDIASRDVRFGYYLYRDAIQHINSGALTQALGTAASPNLFPIIQRQIPDQDCVILLTSDGLSDYDRIEQYWQSKIVSILEGEKNIKQVGESLIHLANETNGHDNTTIALIYCQVKAKPNSQNIVISLPEINASTPTNHNSGNNNQEKPTTAIKGSNSNKSNNKLPIPLATILALLVTGALCYFGYSILKSNKTDQIPTPTNSESIPSPTSSPSQPESTPKPTSSPSPKSNPTSPKPANSTSSTSGN